MKNKFYKIITRKIQIWGDTTFFTEIRKLNNICYQMANKIIRQQTLNDFVVGHLYDNDAPYEDIEAIDNKITQLYDSLRESNKIIKELKSNKDEKKLKKEEKLNADLLKLIEKEKKERSILVGDKLKVIRGELAKILGTSIQNSTYQMLADHYPQVSSYIRSSLNQNITNNLIKDAFAVRMGEKTIRSYKKGMPIPFAKKAIINLTTEGFTFLEHEIKFVFGNDRTRNQELIKKIKNEEFELCDSSIKVDTEKKKIYLLMCVAVPPKDNSLDDTIEAKIDISFGCPLIITNNSTPELIEVGDKSTLIQLRRQFDKRLTKLQTALTHNVSGNGRKKKLQALERLHKAEVNCATTHIHTYAKHAIEAVKKIRAKKIVIYLKDGILADDSEGMILRYWGFHSIIEKLSYKAALEGIEVEVIKETEKEEKEELV